MPKFSALSGALAVKCRDVRLSGSRLRRAGRDHNDRDAVEGRLAVAGYTSTLDSRSAFILFRHPDEPYLVQCRATRTPPVTSNCNKFQ
jgi:hypothetical protein